MNRSFFSLLFVLGALHLAAAANIPVAEYVVIDGHKYFINRTDVTRNEAKAECKSRGMKLISFEEFGKWETVKKYVANNNPYHTTYWMGAKRAANSLRWRWEGSGRTVQNFDWALTFPQYNNDVVYPFCLKFMLEQYFNGWTDSYCDYGVGGILCQ
ncbi:uncharacterized protein LOC132199392 isoform X2 [Neocloeon triangulifer]|uniref:uncharacterized protein LOC132199392 isoform X2 n=1 Tax=Neocloeon triangulifer TaxID=2078957 RepID=UPI00286F41A9|nr:uncharacterized protein LOC132199392 isoform X2 [Neocloeon triangulifer]